MYMYSMCVHLYLSIYLSLSLSIYIYIYIGLPHGARGPLALRGGLPGQRLHQVQGKIFHTRSHKHDWEIHWKMPDTWKLHTLHTVAFHNFNLRIFHLRVSNPNKSIVDVFLHDVGFQCARVSAQQKYEISEIDRIFCPLQVLPGRRGRLHGHPAPLRVQAASCICYVY